MHDKPTYNPALMALITVIAIMAGLLDYYTPPMGDDLSKLTALGGDSYTCPDGTTLKFLAGQYFSCNGRVFDALGPVTVNLMPPIVASLVMGLMTGLYFYSLCACARAKCLGRGTLATALIAVAMFTMPWWDYMWLRVCQFNYMWATAFALLYIRTYFSDITTRGARLPALFILGALAGCGHEQCGVAMTAVTALHLVTRPATRARITLFIGLLAGTAVTLATPAIWSRAAYSQPDATAVEIIVTSLGWVIALIGVTSGVMLSRHGRAMLRDMFSREFGFCFAVAIISSLTALYSGIPGRTGWLAQSLALVALALLCGRLTIVIHRPATIILSVIFIGAIAMHLGTALRYQIKLGKEYNDVIALYRRSADGLVHYPATPRDALPPIVLDRVKGAPDADDTYLLKVIKDACDSRDMLVTISPLTVITDTLPAGTAPYTNFISDTIMICGMSGDRPCVVTPVTNGGTTLYAVDPLVIDRGDHWYPTTTDK